MSAEQFLFMENYLKDYWASHLEKLNYIMEQSGLPNATLTVPLSGIMVLLFFWLLLRMVRIRRASGEIEEPLPGEIEAAELGAAEISEEAVEEEFDRVTEERLDEEPEVDFAVELDEVVELEEAPARDTLVEPLDQVFEIPEQELEKAVEEEVPEAKEPKEPVEEEPKLSWFQRLRNGLQKTKTGFVGKIESLLTGRTKIDDDLYDDLEEILVTSDIGIQTAYNMLESVQEKVDEEGIEDPTLILGILKEQIRQRLKVDVPPIDVTSKKPFVMMVVGVNGTGKTTTIGKIASQYQKEGHKVLLAAADTFRAAAIEQLEVWAERVGCDLIKQTQGADPSAVAYDALDAAIARGADVVIIDTAGRLHNKANLMKELTKIKRVIQKKVGDAPHETLLVLDATTGQNAINQAKEFNVATELSGVVLTKLDGTAKGGCIVGIADEFKLPIRFIGIGEKIDDLRPFDVDDFVNAMF